MTQYDTYIFDLDGTLLDTLGDLAASVNHTMKQFGFPEHSVNDVRRMVGNGIRKLIERAIPQGIENPLYDRVYDAFMAYYLEHSIDTTCPYDGIIDLLQALKQRGKNIAVVSNKYCTATEQLCQHFFKDYVTVAIGESANIRKKPAPDSVLEVMRRMNTDKNHCVYIGDSEVDIETARNSGIPCISVLWGFRDKNFLVSHGATHLVSHPEEITTI
ncbi:MAG: HAD family hydrolase [Prevotella sp.]